MVGGCEWDNGMSLLQQSFPSFPKLPSTSSAPVVFVVAVAIQILYPVVRFATAGDTTDCRESVANMFAILFGKRLFA